MVIIVKTSRGGILGVIEFLADNSAVFRGPVDAKFGDFVKKTLRQGVFEMRDVFDEKTNTLLRVRVKSSRAQAGYPAAFREYLLQSGYVAEEDFPQLREAINKILNEKYSDQNPDKQALQKQLPRMSYLELTYLLKNLQEDR